MRSYVLTINTHNDPILTSSDVDNRLPDQLSPSQVSKNTVASLSFKVKNKKHNSKNNTQSHMPVRYFSSVNNNSPKFTPTIPKYKISCLSLAQTLNFSQGKRASDSNDKSSGDTPDLTKKYQVPRNTEIPNQVGANQTKFEKIIEQALKQRAQHVQSNEQVETESDEEQVKKCVPSTIHCFTMEQFQVGKLLGKGQFGQVFIVKHRETGFIGAMKIIDKEYIVRQKLQVQMARQIKLHSSLKHPNINQMYGFSWDAKHIYLLMELCSDGEVFKILKKRRRTSQKQAAYIIKQMVQAVDYMHSINIIHRDLKPQNMIMHQGLIKVIDFGWATDYKGKHRTTLCGTPLYYSPEMVKKQSYDFTVDLWAIGIMAYQLMIGNIPFSIWTEMQLHKIVKDQIKFPSYVDVSDAAKSFILNILQKCPQKRMKLSDILSHEFLQNVEVMDYVDVFAESDPLE